MGHLPRFLFHQKSLHYMSTSHALWAYPIGAAPLCAGLAEGDSVLRTVDQEGMPCDAELRAVLVVAAVACTTP